MCNKLDYNCHSDSSYARFCKHYAAKKYNRKPNIGIGKTDTTGNPATP